MVTLTPWTLSSSAARLEYFVRFIENPEAPDSSFPTSTNSSNMTSRQALEPEAKSKGEQKEYFQNCRN